MIRDPHSYVMLFMLVMLNSTGLPRSSFSNWKYSVQSKILEVLRKYQLFENVDVFSEKDYHILLSLLKYLGQFLPAMSALKTDLS